MKALESGNAMNVYAIIAEIKNRFDNEEEKVISRSCIRQLRQAAKNHRKLQKYIGPLCEGSRERERYECVCSLLH